MKTMEAAALVQMRRMLRMPRSNTMRKPQLIALSLLALLFLASCQIYVVDPPFSARFNNMLYTDIRVTVEGYGSRVIAPGETVTFSIDKSDGSYHYHAETWGTDANGERIGLIVDWNRTNNISGESYTTYLITYPDLFFLKMRNTGYHSLRPLYVNYGLSDQTVDNILIPANNVLYSVGYYFAHGSTRVQANWVDMPNDYTYWQQGQHFYFPWAQNQSVTLTSNYKKGADPLQGCEVHSNPVKHNSGEPFGMVAGVPRPESGSGF